MKRSKITGIVCTAVLHLGVLALLFLLTFSVPEEQEEGGVPVMLGDAESGGGEEEAYSLTEVDVMPSSEEVPESETADRPMISQEEDSPMQVEKEPSRKEQVQEAVPKPEVKEKTEAEKRAEAERAAAQAAANKIAGAFGKGSKMGSTGDGTGTHRQGSAAGNSDEGKTSGVGSAYALQGRSLGTGSLPVPVYDVQDEGRVVVTIVVNPAGQVIRTSINKRTNTVNPALRRAALEAAQKARFNAIDGVDNQSGTITYYFKLK